MARKPTPQPPPTPDPELQVSREEATQKINERIAAGGDLYMRQISNMEQLEAAENEYRRWNSYNTELLKRLFTTHKFAEDKVFAVHGHDEAARESVARFLECLGLEAVNTS